MNNRMRQSNAWVKCPECEVFYHDGHRHRSGYKDSLKRCPRQHVSKSNKNSKKGISNHAGSPYSRGG